jgi:hypothetical protein
MPKSVGKEFHLYVLNEYSSQIIFRKYLTEMDKSSLNHLVDYSWQQGYIE